MKRTLLCMAMILMAGLYSCQQNNEFLPLVEEPSAREEGATRVSPEEAVKMADSYLQLLSSGTRSARKSPTVEVYGKDVALTRASGTEIPDTLLYIVNYGGEGFALIAADYRMDDLYALSDEGSFNLSDTTRFPEMKYLIGMIEQYAASSMKAATRAEIVASSDYRLWFVQERIEKNVDAKWDQNALPFNEYCYKPSGGRADAGCAPIAISQIMYYHGCPGSHTNTQNGQVFTYDWNQMKSVTNAATGSVDAQEQVARLIEQIGSECNATYGDKTGVLDTDLAPCFEKMGYTVNGQQLTNYNIALIKNGLSNYGPVFACGSEFGLPNSGHAWIFDGYLKMQNITGSPNLGVKEFVKCNWGSSGFGDGYFISGIFNRREGVYAEEYGGWTTIAGGNYNYNLKIIPYISPKTYTVTLNVSNITYWDQSIIFEIYPTGSYFVDVPSMSSESVTFTVDSGNDIYCFGAYTHPEDLICNYECIVDRSGYVNFELSGWGPQWRVSSNFTPHQSGFWIRE